MNEIRARWRDAAGFSREVVTARLFGEEDDLFVPRHYARLGDEVVDHPFGEDGGNTGVGNPLVIFDLEAGDTATGDVQGSTVWTVNDDAEFGMNVAPLAGKAIRIKGGTNDNAFVMDGTEGYIGLGRTDPEVMLDLQRATNTAIRIRSLGVNSDATLFLGNDAIQWTTRCGIDDKLHFRNFTAGTDFVTIATDGKVGIGTTTPSYSVDVSQENPVLALNDTVSTDRFSALLLQTAGGAFWLRNGRSGAPFENYLSISDGAASTDVFFTVKRLGDGGGVGINKVAAAGRRLDVGTTGQASALYVRDSDGVCLIPHDTAFALSIGTELDLRLWHDSNNSWVYGYTGSLVVGTSNAGDLQFRTSGAIRGSFTSTGILHLTRDGTSSIPNLSIGAGSDLRLWHDGTSNFVLGYTGSVFLGSATASSALFMTNNSTRGYINSTGGWIIGGSAAIQAGAKLDVQTTAEAHALYVADADGTLHSPWDGSSGSPNIAIGAGEDLRLHAASGAAFIYSHTSSLYVGTPGGNAASVWIQTLGLNRARFDSSGSFVLGSAAIQAGSKFDVQTTGQAHALWVRDSDGVTLLPFDNANAFRLGASGHFRQGYAGGAAYALCYSGVMIAGTGAANASDYRMQVNGATVLAATTRGTAQITPLASDPGTPADGDVWVTTGGDLKFRANGTTYTVTKT